MLRPAVVCSVVMVLFDSGASFLSKVSGIYYEWFTLPQLAMYIIMGYVLVRGLRLNQKQAVMTLLSAAIVEATIGEWVSLLIGPRTLSAVHPNAVGFIVTAIIAAGIQTLFGWIGVLIGRTPGRTRVAS